VSAHLGIGIVQLELELDRLISPESGSAFKDTTPQSDAGFASCGAVKDYQWCSPLDLLPRHDHLLVTLIRWSQPQNQHSPHVFSSAPHRHPFTLFGDQPHAGHGDIYAITDEAPLKNDGFGKTYKSALKMAYGVPSVQDDSN
jgi:hypothetical protein